MNNYLTTLARRASGEISAAIEPPARLTFLPDNDPSANPAESSHQYPPAFEASTVGRGAAAEEDTSSPAADRRSQAPVSRLAPPPSLSDRWNNEGVTEIDGSGRLPEGTRIVGDPAENRGLARRNDQAGRPEIIRKEAPSSSPDRTDEADRDRSPRGDTVSFPRVDWPSADRGGRKLSPVVEPPGMSDRGEGLRSRGQTIPGDDKPRASGPPEADSEASGAASRSAPEVEPDDGATDPEDHPLPVEPPDEPGRFNTNSGRESVREPGRSSVRHSDEEARRPRNAASDVTARAVPPDRSFERGSSGRKSDATPSVEVHIGTIELRETHSDAPEQDRSAGHEPSEPTGFDDYAAQRRYEI